MTARTVVLDVGGVLFRNALGPKTRDLAARHRLPVVALRAFCARHRRDVDLGVTGEREFWREMLSRSGVEPTEEDLEIERYVVAMPGAFEALEALRRRYRLAILSNDSIEFSLARRSRLPFPIEDAVISADAGAVKPDQAIYRALLDRIGEPAAACVMVDDKPANVRAARVAGMQAFRFRDWPDALRRLVGPP